MIGLLDASRRFGALLVLLAIAACAGHPRLAQLPQTRGAVPEITLSDDGTRHCTTLSVLIYNVAGLPWPVRAGRPAALRTIGAELAALQQEGRAPDLLLLQEAFTPKAGRIGIRAGYPNWVRGPRAADRPTVEIPPHDADFLAERSFWKGERLGKLVSSGLYVYSRYPIVDLHMTAFGRHTCGGYDCLANKGVMLALIEMPGVPAPVQILNTHLNARFASGVSRERSLYAHQRQIDEIRLLLDRHFNPDWPFIFGGDFNTRRAPDRYDHKVEQIPGTVVDYYCVVMVANCDIRMSWDGDEPWIDTQDLQGFQDGATVSVRPIRIEAMFDEPRDGEMLSDHDGYLVTYELSWPAPLRPTAARH